MFDENRRIIRITSAAFKGYFPQHIESKYFASEIRHEYGWGDKNIEKMIIGGKLDDESIAAVEYPDFYTEEYIERFFNHSLKIMEEEEENCDIGNADYVRKNFKNSILFMDASCCRGT
ncbi:MAG: hypothetical protein IJX66_09775 [Lachnospiraceae bacterium]|nr:hypothetical protein [Lachnospiraceae bacterium]